MGDHTESVLVEYDPTQVSLEQLLNKFWNEHSPLSRGSKQYQSGIWYFNAQQKSTIAAYAGNASETKYGGRQIKTVIQPAGTFYRAEEYHQKFLLKRNGR
eukprot:m.478266 g.478266  ORF g.478266 m.478266 type:complete len:100 (+) comp21091_c0_seq1:278-577(+)